MAKESWASVALKITGEDEIERLRNELADLLEASHRLIDSWVALNISDPEYDAARAHFVATVTAIQVPSDDPETTEQEDA